MSLTSGLYVGTSGLQTSQNALNTTAHNLSNMETEGYVRQQVLSSDKVYNTIKKASVSVSAQQVGIGVTYAKVRQVRDYFLDLSYRREAGRSAFYDESYNAMTEVEDLLDEMNDDASFNKSLSNFWSTIEELAKTPDDTTVQRMLVQNAQSFLTNASQVYQGLIDYQNELNAHIKDQVNHINELGNRIYSLNDKIRSIEVGGVEEANDLRDERNHCLDELASLVNIKYSEDLFGSVRVAVEGVDFVASDTVYEMNVVQDTVTGFYIPYWEFAATPVSDSSKAGENVYTANDGSLLDISAARVFNMNALISSEKNTDVGKLRAMLYIRGDKVANYADIPVKPEPPEEADYAGDPVGLEAAKAKYLADLDRYEADTDYYNHTVAQSVCMNIQAEFDQLIHNVVTTVNKIFEDVSDPTTGYMCDDDGSPLQLFQKIASDGYRFEGGEWKFNEENTVDKTRTETLYSIPNLQVNPTLIREAGKMGFVFPDGTVDYETAAKLIAGFDADIYVLNPNVTTKCSINSYYSSLVSQVANSGSVYKNISDSQQATVNSIYNSREQVQGVSSDEELTSMIKFQNAYNASSRYITVIDEMLEHIIQTLAV
ncbi:MAG: flagellar hook-associated protein FlgK [Lachnospiraceae bacterium]|nr:flagellar hook-associated protein FlgK [Lachnospiraceae bacterium]